MVPCGGVGEYGNEDEDEDEDETTMTILHCEDWEEEPDEGAIHATADADRAPLTHCAACTTKLPPAAKFCIEVRWRLSCTCGGAIKY